MGGRCSTVRKKGGGAEWAVIPGADILGAPNLCYIRHFWPVTRKNGGRGAKFKFCPGRIFLFASPWEDVL